MWGDGQNMSKERWRGAKTAVHRTVRCGKQDGRGESVCPAPENGLEDLGIHSIQAEDLESEQ